MQKFSELPYTRPDIAAAVEEYKRYSEAFKAAKTFEEAKKVFLDAEKLDTHLSTIASLCSIRNTMNTTDEFYETEMAYLNENLPNLIPAEKAMKEDIVNGRSVRTLKRNTARISSRFWKTTSRRRTSALSRSL